MMRFTIFLAALASLWIQPAKAGVIITAVGEGEYRELLSCIPANPDEGCTEEPTIIRGLFAIHAAVPDHYVSSSGAIFVDEFSSPCPFMGTCNLTAQLGGAFSFDAFARGFDPVQSIQVSGPSFQYVEAEVMFFEASFNAVRGVPEPTIWAMMLLGFFGMGAALRTQRPRVALSPVFSLKR